MDNWAEWIDGLKAGDKVAVTGTCSLCIGTVARTTKTQIITAAKNGAGREYEKKWRRKDGQPVGSDVWSRERISRVTDEIVEAVRVRQIKLRFQRMSARTWSTERMEAVLEVLDCKKQAAPGSTGAAH